MVTRGVGGSAGGEVWLALGDGEESELLLVGRSEVRLRLPLMSGEVTGSDNRLRFELHNRVAKKVSYKELLLRRSIAPSAIL